MSVPLFCKRQDKSERSTLDPVDAFALKSSEVVKAAGTKAEGTVRVLGTETQVKIHDHDFNNIRLEMSRVFAVFLFFSKKPLW